MGKPTTLQDNNRKALSAGLWYTVSNLLIRGVNVFTTPIFSRMLTKTEFGNFNNYVAIMTVLTVVTTFDLYTSVNRARFDYKENLDEYLSSITVLTTLVTAFFYLLCMVFSAQAQELFSLDMTTLHIMFLYMLTAPAINILQAKHRIQMKYVAFIFISVLTVLGNALLSVGLIMVMHDRYLGRLVGSALPTIIVGVIIYALIVMKGKTLYKKEYWKYSLKISLPLVPHLVSATLLAQFSRIMVFNVQGAEVAAEFGLVCNISLILIMLWNSLNNAWQPWSMERMHTKEYGQLRSASRSYMALFFVLVGGLIAIGPEVLDLMGTKDYQGAKYLMPFILLGPAMQFVANFYINIEIYKKKTLFASIVTIVAAGINIALNLLLQQLGQFTSLTAAVTMLFGYIAFMLLHFVFSHRIEKARMYDEKLMFMGLGALMSVSAVMTLLYDLPIWRYLLLVVLLSVVAFLMRSEIKGLLNIFFHKNSTPDMPEGSHRFGGEV